MKSSDKEPKILFHDSHILVALKPPGLVVPIEGRGEDSLEGWLKEHLKKELDKETIFLRPIHRLDKPVEGLVLFARSSKALSRLNKAQREKGFQKFYVAKVSGKSPKPQRVLKHLLIHADYRAEVVRKGGKEARLRYRRLDQSSSILSIQLLTGRYHQIRVQLSEEGHPIVGDRRYGSEVHFKKNQIALFHTKLIFTHPVLKKRMVFKFRPKLEALNFA